MWSISAHGDDLPRGFSRLCRVPEPTLLREAAMLARSCKAVLEGADWLTAAKLADLAPERNQPEHAQPNKWQRQR